MLLKNLIYDPPPAVVFEIAEAGIAAARIDPKRKAFEARAERALAPGAVEPSAVKPNVRQPALLGEAVASLLEELGALRRSEVALILPDNASRLTVLDFDSLPSDVEGRLQAIRSRLTKTVPFDVETARIAYQATKVGAAYAVLAAVTPTDIIQQYEEVFEQAGLWPGYVSSSASEMLNLVPTDGTAMVAKLSGRSLTMAAVHGDVVRTVRVVEAARQAEEEPRLTDLLADLYPTMIFVEDNYGARVERLFLCGFGELLDESLERLPAELGCRVEPLRSPEGVCGPHDAGLWGYLRAS